tara:strand:+ start:246 stop:2351 length:2106 start_codon:yes stop_codon:yes gene_type:complete
MDYLEIERTYEEFNNLLPLLNKIEQCGLDDSMTIFQINSLNPTHYSDIKENMIYKKSHRDSAVILSVQKVQDILEIEYMELMYNGVPKESYNKDFPNDFIQYRVGIDQIELDENGELQKNIIPLLTQLGTEDIETFCICNMIINNSVINDVVINKNGEWTPIHNTVEDIGTFIYMIDLLDDYDTIIEGRDIINVVPINEFLVESRAFFFGFTEIIIKWSENILMLYSRYITLYLNQSLYQNTIDNIAYIFTELLKVYTSTCFLIKDAIKFNEKIKQINDNESLQLYEHFNNIIGTRTTFSYKMEELQSRFNNYLTIFSANTKNKISTFNGNINIFELPKDIDNMLLSSINEVITALKEFDEIHVFMKMAYKNSKLDYRQYHSTGVYSDYTRIDNLITPTLLYITANLELYLYQSIWEIINIYSAIIKASDNKLMTTSWLGYYLYSYILYNSVNEPFKNLYTIIKLLPEFIDYTKAFTNVYAKVLVMYEETEEDIMQGERKLIDNNWDRLTQELRSMSIEQLWNRAIEDGIPNEDILAAYHSVKNPSERKNKLIHIIASNTTKNIREGVHISRRYDELRPKETTAQELSTSRFDTLRRRGNEWADRQNYIIRDNNSVYTDPIRKYHSTLPLRLQTELGRLRTSIKRSEIEDTPIMNLEGQYELAEGNRVANFLEDISQYGGKRKTKKKQKKKQRTKKKLLKK